MKDNKKIFQSLTLVSQFAIHMLVPIFMCSYLGYLLDRRMGTSFIFVVFFFMGAAAGGRNIFLLARKIYDEKDKYPSRMYSSGQKQKKCNRKS